MTTMSLPHQLITITVVVIGTMITRFLPFLLFPENKTPPAYITYLGNVLPYATMGLLVIFCLKDAVTRAFAFPELLTILFIVIIHKWKHSTFLSIGLGTVFYMVLIQNIFFRKDAT